MAVKLRTMRLFYFMAGIGISTWAIIVPFSKIRFRLDDGTLGLILFSAGFGGLLAMPFCGPLIARFGSRRVLVSAGIVFGVVLPLLAVAPSVPWFTGLLFIDGLTFGVIDVALNAQGAVMETQSGTRQMSMFHAMFSIGGLTVAVATSFLLRLGLSNAECAALCGGAIFLILGQGTNLLPKWEDLPAEGPAFAAPDRAAVVLGLCCFACFLTEGAVTDWSTIFLKFSRGMPVASAALGYAAFSLAMAVSRALGDKMVTRLGAAAVMRLGCGVAVGGLLIAIVLPFGPAGALGFGLVGLGIGNIAPLVFSAAARVPGLAAKHAVPAVVGMGYAGFLMGPVVIGLVARAASLSVSLGLDAALLLAIGFAARAVAEKSAIA